MAAETALLDLVTPTQGTLTGSWGNTVNNGITEYVDIAIAGTLTLTGDGAVDLVNSVGDASATNIVSTLSGAGSVTAQFAVVKISGTTTAKTVTGPSTSKTYIVDNAGSYTVTFKASGQSGVSVVAGEKCTVYFNGTDYVKVAGTSTVSSFSAGTTGLTPSTATTGAVTLAGTLATANGGTNLTSFTSGGVVYASSTSALATGSALQFTGSNLGIGRTPVAYSSFTVLDVAGSAGAIQKWVHTGSTVELQAYASSTLTTVGSATNHPLLFVTNDTERARVDTAGYLSGVWADEVSALGNTGTAKTITCTAGNVFTATLTGNCTFTLASPSTTTASTATSFTLILTNDGTAGRTVSWAGGTFLWPGGAASLSRTTTANATDIWFFFSPNGGTTWYGNISQKNLTA